MSTVTKSMKHFLPILTSVLGAFVLAGCAQEHEHECMCGQSGPEPYVYVVTAQNIDEATIECSSLGAECVVIQ